MYNDTKKKKFKKLLNTIIFFSHSPIFKILLVILFIVFFTMFSIIMIEGHKTEGIDTLFDSFWYTIVTLTTVGYGDITPKSIPGRIIGLVTMAFGVVLVAALSGKIASLLVDLGLRRGKGLVKLKNLQKHFIICGWRNDFERIIDGIIEANPSIDSSDLVLINSAPAEQMELFMINPKYKLINYIHGDFIDENVLKRASIEKASRVLILADNSGDYSPVEIDSRTVMAVLTIENLNRNIYTAAELLDDKFEKYLQFAHCDEIILTKEYVRILLVNASGGSGISHVVRDLLSIQNSSGNITIKDIPNSFYGDNFKTLGGYFFEKKDSILIGILENSGNFYSRKKEALIDAQKTPDISKIVENLKKVKELKANNPVINPGKDYIIKEHSRAIIVTPS